MGVRSMNLAKDCRDVHASLCPEVVPVLLLVKEWSELGGDVYSHTELIFLVLEVVCGFEGSDEGVTLQSLVERLQTVGNGSMAETFKKSVEESATDLTCFMNLFEHTLPRLLSSPNENSSPLLDKDCVLGVWEDWGPPLLLTARSSPQDKVASFISQQDYTATLRESVLPSNRNDTPSTEHDIGLEALKMTSIHGHFGHTEEGIKSVHEAIRLALQDNNSLLLEHCLAWLHRLQPFEGEDAKTVLKRFITTAEELKEPLLGGWGRLEESKALLALGEEPKKVLLTLLSSQSTEYVPIYYHKADKTAHISAVLATMATVWEQYGFRHVGQLYCQLQGHMMSCDPLPTEKERESFVLCVSILARHLLHTGDFKAACSLLSVAKEHLKSHSKSYTLLCQCVEEVGFDWSVQTGDITTANQHLNRLASLNEESFLIRSAILKAAEGNHAGVQTLVHQLSNAQSPVKARALILLAEIHCSTGNPSLSLPLLMDSLSVCNTHHLSPYLTKLWLAQAQLQMDSPLMCEALARECLLHFQASGDALNRGASQFLLAQATLCGRSQRRGQLEKEDALAVIPVLEKAVADFERVSAIHYLHKAATLLAVVYDLVGYHHQRDEMAETATTTKNSLYLKDCNL